MAVRRIAPLLGVLLSVPDLNHRLPTIEKYSHILAPTLLISTSPGDIAQNCVKQFTRGKDAQRVRRHALEAAGARVAGEVSVKSTGRVTMGERWILR